MTFADLGFDKFLNKPSNSQNEIPEDEIDILLQAISGSKITEGVSQSTNKRMDVNYDQGQIQFKDGDNTRVEIGKFIDGKFGLRVYGADGVSVAVDSTN